jgi:PII-like signaling protein
MRTIKLEPHQLRKDGLKYANVMRGAAGFRGDIKILSEQEELRLAIEELRERLKENNNR